MWIHCTIFDVGKITRARDEMNKWGWRNKKSSSKVGSSLIEKVDKGECDCFIGKYLRDVKSRYVHLRSHRRENRKDARKEVILISSCTWPTAVWIPRLPLHHLKLHTVCPYCYRPAFISGVAWDPFSRGKYRPRDTKRYKIQLFRVWIQARRHNEWQNGSQSIWLMWEEKSISEINRKWKMLPRNWNCDKISSKFSCGGNLLKIYYTYFWTKYENIDFSIFRKVFIKVI